MAVMEQMVLVMVARLLKLKLCLKGWWLVYF